MNSKRNPEIGRQSGRQKRAEIAQTAKNIGGVASSEPPISYKDASKAVNSLRYGNFSIPLVETARDGCHGFIDFSARLDQLEHEGRVANSSNSEPVEKTA